MFHRLLRLGKIDEAHVFWAGPSYENVVGSGLFFHEGGLKSMMLRPEDNSLLPPFVGLIEAPLSQMRTWLLGIRYSRLTSPSGRARHPTHGD